MSNVANISQLNDVLALTHTGSAYECPSIVDSHTAVETEQLWKKRLNMFVRAEERLLKIKRMRKVTALFIVASSSVLFFSFYMAPTLSPTAFLTMFVLMVFGLVTYPAWFLLGKDSQKQRDAISKMFYQSNHELEIAEGKVTLINRANYTNVTYVHMMNPDAGYVPR